MQTMAMLLTALSYGASYSTRNRNQRKYSKKKLKQNVTSSSRTRWLLLRAPHAAVGVGIPPSSLGHSSPCSPTRCQSRRDFLGEAPAPSAATSTPTSVASVLISTCSLLRGRSLLACSFALSPLAPCRLLFGVSVIALALLAFLGRARSPRLSVIAPRLL